MSELTISGRVVANLGMQTGISKAGKEWAKATIILETSGKYPKKIALDNMKSAEQFATIAVGAELNCSIDIESHEYNGRWFTGVTCYKWDLSTSGQNAPQPAAQSQPAPPPADAYNDLPF